MLESIRSYILYLHFISIQNFRMFLYTSVYSNYLRIAKEDGEETLKAQLMTYKDQVSIIILENMIIY